MGRRLAGISTVAMLVLSSFSAIPYASPPPRAAAPYQITDLRAHLFYSDRGVLSDNLLARPRRLLWNTVIGEGEAGGPSSAMLIVIEVAGAPGSFESARRVELAVRAPRGEIFRRQLVLDVLGPRGRGYSAFWLYGTGCEPLTISTALLGQADPSRRVAEVPFHCGE